MKTEEKKVDEFSDRQITVKTQLGKITENAVARIKNLLKSLAVKFSTPFTFTPFPPPPAPPANYQKDVFRVGKICGELTLHKRPKKKGEES